MDDSGMAGVTAIGAILGKRVFKRMLSKNWKPGIGINPTASVDELASVTSVKSEADGLEEAGGIEDNSVSGSS